MNVLVIENLTIESSYKVTRNLENLNRIKRVYNSFITDMTQFNLNVDFSFAINVSQLLRFYELEKSGCIGNN